MGEIKSKSSVKEVKSKMPRFKKPKWLRVKLPVGQEYKKVRNIVDKYRSNADDRIDVLVLNAKHFGSGLNLENTTDIFLYHNMGGPMTNQVLGRAQRPGRTSPLRITRFCYENEI